VGRQLLFAATSRGLMRGYQVASLTSCAQFATLDSIQNLSHSQKAMTAFTESRIGADRLLLAVSGPTVDDPIRQDDPNQPFDLFQSGRSNYQVASVYGEFIQSCERPVPFRSDSERQPT
jgi:hypothetical protein